MHEAGHVLGFGVALGTSDIMDAWRFNSANIPAAIRHFGFVCI